MAYVYSWDVGKPADDTKSGTGARGIRDTKKALDERLISDGVHLPKLAGDPANVPLNGCAVYNKSDGTDEEVHLYDSAGNVIQISKGGHLYVPSRMYSFRAHMSGNQNINHSTTTKIQFDTEDWDIGTIYDNAVNYRLIIPIDGLWEMKALLQFSPVTNGCYCSTQLYKNGVAYLIDYRESGAAVINATPWLSTIETCLATDFFEIYAFHDSGVVEQVQSSKSFFVATLLGSV